MDYKRFVGPTVRALRDQRHWTLEHCAGRLGISVSYLSQIEANKRPVTQRVVLALTDVFDEPAETFDADAAELLVSDLREAVVEAARSADPVPLSELRQAAQFAPTLARRFVDLQRANHQLRDR